MFINTSARPDRDWPYFLGIVSSIFVVWAVFYFPDPMRHFLTGLILFFGIGMQWYDILSYKKRQKKAGNLLMDVGLDLPRRWLFIVLAAIEFIIVILLLYRNGFHTLFNRFALIFGLSIGVYIAFQAKHCRLRLHENGVVYNTNFIPWHRIAAMEWIENSGCYLVAKRAKTMFPLNQILKWPVAPSSKEAISIVLRRKFEEFGG